MNLPQDDYILLSVVNTALRDTFSDFTKLCKEYGWDCDKVVSRLEALGYCYNENVNAFVAE